MAACTISTVLSDAACFSNGALNPKQQKLALIDLYYLWGVSAGADVPLTVAGWTEFAKCYQVLTDDQVKAIEIQAVINGINVISPTVITPSDLITETKCVEQLSDKELDRILVALKCSLFQNLTPVV